MGRGQRSRKESMLDLTGCVYICYLGMLCLWMIYRQQLAFRCQTTFRVTIYTRMLPPLLRLPDRLPQHIQNIAPHRRALLITQNMTLLWKALSRMFRQTPWAAVSSTATSTAATSGRCSALPGESDLIVSTYLSPFLIESRIACLDPEPLRHQGKENLETKRPVSVFWEGA